MKEIKCHPWVGWIDKERYMSGGYVMPFERNLSMIDFDCEELGESENRFTIKIGIEYKL